MSPAPNQDRSYIPYNFRKVLEEKGKLPARPSKNVEGKVPQRHHDARPNVLWLMADQYRADMLSCAEHPAIRTPNLDRLAARGVRFNRSYCNSPVCLPSRASMLSGLSLPRHGGLTNGINVAPKIPFFADKLQQAGYRTASIGKTHCGRNAAEIWEYNDHAKDSFGATKPSEVPFDPTIFPELVFIADEVCDDSDRVLYGTYPGPVQTTKSRHLANKAINWLYYHDDPRPFFLRVSFDDPHPPVVPTAEYAALYGPKDVPEEWLRERQASFDTKTETVREYAKGKGLTRITEEQHRLHYARYMALCTQLDAEIGRVLDALEEFGFSDNTLVLFNSDHGHMLGEHGLTHKHYLLYEGVNRIPTILSWPGKLPEGKVCEELVDGTDVAATFLDALGVESFEMEGKSLLPVARGGKGRSFTIAQYDDFCFSITTNRNKLIRYDSDATNVGELYDLATDPWERKNLWNETALREVQTTLLTNLEQWRRERGAAVKSI